MRTIDLRPKSEAYRLLDQATPAGAGWDRLGGQARRASDLREAIDAFGRGEGIQERFPILDWRSELEIHTGSLAEILAATPKRWLRVSLRDIFAMPRVKFPMEPANGANLLGRGPGEPARLAHGMAEAAFQEEAMLAMAEAFAADAPGPEAALWASDLWRMARIKLDSEGKARASAFWRERGALCDGVGSALLSGGRIAKTRTLQMLDAIALDAKAAQQGDAFMLAATKPFLPRLAQLAAADGRDPNWAAEAAAVHEAFSLRWEIGAPERGEPKPARL